VNPQGKSYKNGREHELLDHLISPRRTGLDLRGSAIHGQSYLAAIKLRGFEESALICPILLAQHFRQLTGWEACARAPLSEPAEVAAARSFARMRERKRLFAVHHLVNPESLKRGHLIGQVGKSD